MGFRDFSAFGGPGDLGDWKSFPIRVDILVLVSLLTEESNAEKPRRGGDRGGLPVGVLRGPLSLHGLPFTKALLLLFAEFMY